MIMAQNLDDAASAAKRFKNDDVPDVDSAIDGACDIIAEWMSESEKARSIVRSRYMRNAVISSKVGEGQGGGRSKLRKLLRFLFAVAHLHIPIASWPYCAVPMRDFSRSR